MKMKYPSPGLYLSQINKGIGDTVEVEYGTETEKLFSNWSLVNQLVI